MYLKHLATHGELITVIDPRTGGICFMTEELVLARIREGLIKPIGPKNCVRELHWHGAIPWRAVTSADEAAGYKPSEPQPTNYSYDYETPTNPQNCWALKDLPNSTAKSFRAVWTGCIAPFFDPDLQP